MATLTINFTTDPTAVKYRVKYRKTGTSTYSTVETTASPVTVNNILCGEAYEGTVQAICFEGTPCNRYRISTTDPAADGDVNYDDCATGNSASQSITGSGDFYVCSRTVPVVQGSSSTSVTEVSQGTCESPSPEQVSAPVYWTASAVSCPNYTVRACTNPGDTFVIAYDPQYLIGGSVTLNEQSGCWEIIGTTTATPNVTELVWYPTCTACNNAQP